MSRWDFDEIVVGIFFGVMSIVMTLMIIDFIYVIVNWASKSPEEQQRIIRQVQEEESPIRYYYEALNGYIGLARHCEVSTAGASAGTALGIGGASYTEGAGYLCSKEYDGSNQFPVKSFWLIEDDKEEK